MTQIKKPLEGFNIFKKSEQEKLELKNAKAEWKKLNKQYNGSK